MSIYPDRSITEHQRLPKGGESWVEVETEPGIIRRRRVLATNWAVERTDCFCCSCVHREGEDPACRNHGWAARRPCDEHGMPGQRWGYGSPRDGEMPSTVQAYLRGEGS